MTFSIFKTGWQFLRTLWRDVFILNFLQFIGELKMAFNVYTWWHIQRAHCWFDEPCIKYRIFVLRLLNTKSWSDYLINGLLFHLPVGFLLSLKHVFVFVLSQRLKQKCKIPNCFKSKELNTWSDISFYYCFSIALTWFGFTLFKFNFKFRFMHLNKAKN